MGFCNEFILLDCHRALVGVTLCKGEGASLECSFTDAEELGEDGERIGIFCIP